MPSARPSEEYLREDEELSDGMPTSVELRRMLECTEVTARTLDQKKTMGPSKSRQHAIENAVDVQDSRVCRLTRRSFSYLDASERGANRQLCSECDEVLVEESA